jgi:hypothetical protein
MGNLDIAAAKGLSTKKGAEALAAVEGELLLGLAS